MKKLESNIRSRSLSNWDICRFSLLILLSLPVAMTVGCPNYSPPPPGSVSVTVSPHSATLQVNSQQQFTASVNYGSNPAVKWTASGGTISASGMYTAPGSAGTFTVTATSEADSSKSDVATLTITTTAPAPTPTPTPTPGLPPPAVSVIISPSIINLPTNGTQQFTAVVKGTSNTAVTWTATAGNISSTGLYTAPASVGSPTVTATSVADSTKSASAPVLVGGAGSMLAQAAAQATPGQWFHFTAAETSNFGGGSVLNLPSGASDNATTWSTKGMWNPVTKEFVFLGGAHCGSGASGCPNNMITLMYTDATNTWSTVAVEGTHTYQGATLNTSAGADNNVYFRPFDTENVQVFSMASHSWSGSIASVPSVGLDCCLALEYFPDRNSLITVDNDWGINEYSFASGSWSGCLIGTTSGGGCPNGTHAFCDASSTAAPWAFYDSHHHQMLLGGCTNVYALSTNLAITQLPSAPFDISVGTSASPATYDPGTGKLMSWDTSGNTFTFDGSTWTNVGKSPFSDPVKGGLVCAPVSSYNVVMCIYAGASGAPLSGATVWVYKGQ